MLSKFFFESHGNACSKVKSFLVASLCLCPAQSCAINFACTVGSLSWERCLSLIKFFRNSKSNGSLVFIRRWQTVPFTKAWKVKRKLEE